MEELIPIQQWYGQRLPYLATQRGCVNVTIGSSISMDINSSEDGLLIKRGSAEANTIKDVINSKIHGQANNSPTKPSSPGPAANIISNKETSYPKPAATTTPNKEPISLAIPSHMV